MGGLDQSHHDKSQTPAATYLSISPRSAAAGIDPDDCIHDRGFDLMPCPSANDVLVLTPGALPANLGSTVSVVSLGLAATFGSLSSRSGTVTLTKSGSSPITVSDQDVLWSPVAVTFTVPHDLPASSGDTTWEIRLRAADASSDCGPYALTVRAYPVILFVPPTCVAERRLDVAAVGISARAQVQFFDRTGKRIAHNIPAQKRTPTGIACQVPTLRELMEASTELDTNQLTMPLYVRIFDPDTGTLTPQNELHKTIAVLPPPTMGPLAGTPSPDTLLFGDAARPAELGDQLSLEWVGDPARGSVTFHPFNERLMHDIAALHRDIGAALDPENLDVTLPPDIARRAETLREQGQRGEVLRWTEETIEVKKPTGWKAGAVCIWRDSLPTLPLVVPADLLPDLTNTTVLRSALGELFAFEVINPVLDPAVPLQARLVPTPGDVALTPVAGMLKQLIRDGKVNLGLTFRPVGQTEFKWPGNNTVAATLDRPAALAEGLLVRPNVVRDEATLGAGEVGFHVNVDAVLRGIPDALGDLTVTLTGPALKQLPLRVPTVAAFFEKRDWVGECLLLVHHQTTLVKGAYDRNDLGGVGAAKAAITGALGKVTSALGILSAAHLFPDILGASSLGAVQKFLGILESLPADKLVISAEQARGTLNYNPAWWDKASSMFMIGAPLDPPTLSLYERDNQTSHRCDFRLPARYLAASYWTLHESAFGPNRASYSSTPTVPDPGVNQAGVDKYPYGSFGDMAKSFLWH